MSPPSPRYTLLDSLGKGGMGEVFLADDAQLDRKVAIKFLTAALENDTTARERLHREARSAAALDHPYICHIYELAEIDGRTGIVMEHVSGETLQMMLRRSRPSATRALEIAACTPKISPPPPRLRRGDHRKGASRAPEARNPKPPGRSAQGRPV